MAEYLKGGSTITRSKGQATKFTQMETSISAPTKRTKNTAKASFIGSICRDQKVSTTEEGGGQAYPAAREFTNAQMVSLGINSGDIYHGEFKNGLKHGEGSERFANGDSYTGLYVNGLPDGYG